MNLSDLLRQAYDQGVKIALDETDFFGTKESADATIESPSMPIERPHHHDVPLGRPARFSTKGREYPQKKAEEEPEYVSRARDYADRYHKSLLARFKAEHEAKDKPPVPKVST